jgi:hypothetical protein
VADTIVCAVCGEINPVEMEFCQNCQSRLQPLTGRLRAENGPIQPGDAPTKKVTSDLEAALPRWLREARAQARQSADGEEGTLDLVDSAQQPGPPDLLAGLASQGQHAVEPESDTPDWVAKITGTTPKSKGTERGPTKVNRVELGDEEEWTAPRNAQDDVAPPESRPATVATEQDQQATWFKEASASPTQDTHTSADGLASPQMPALTEAGTNNEVPDWLKGLDAEVAFGTAQGSRSHDSQSATDDRGNASKSDLPDWLSNLGGGADGQAINTGENLPSWLKPPKEPSQGAPAFKPPKAAPEGAAMPDWVASPMPPREPPVQPEPLSAPAKADQASATIPRGASVFTEDVLSGGDVDAIFASMQMPDWLSDVKPIDALSNENLPPAAQDLDPIAPAQLPSWVRAMRPVESAMPEAAAGTQDFHFEDGGPLAGLQGVLPTMPGAGAATSKPKSQSVKLEATEQQQAHAELLEKILSAEITPIPMKGTPLLGTQRGLRWAVSGLLLGILGATLLAKTQVFPVPLALPTESYQAVQAIEAIPMGSPVLVVFDYEPATMGEMEATAASAIDHLLLLRHPNLALVSTSPTGPALAERFMSTVVGGRGYQRGSQYANLGFLPGGLAGLRDFAQNPTGTISLDAESSRIWDSGVLRGVTRLSDFTSIIVLTDSQEAGRAWIEQTTGWRGSGSLIVICSAQAGPLLLPYVDSGQMNGLVAGMNGAVGVEQANGGLPGTVREYWDAYSVGLYLAVVLIVVGGMWNWWLGVQDKRAEQAG